MLAELFTDEIKRLREQNEALCRLLENELDYLKVWIGLETTNADTRRFMRYQYDQIEETIRNFR
jgi:hypothetical protein